nr:uncharacterized protein LOC109171655 [Ipomoea trifida]
MMSSYSSNLTPLRCIDSASRLGVGVLSSTIPANDAVITSIEHIYFNQQVAENWVAGTIVDVESVVDWYYISCKTNSMQDKLF